MTALKIGIQTTSLRQPLKKALHTAARLGADGVEIDLRTELPPGELTDTGLRQFRKLLGDLNLRVSAVAFPTREGYDSPNLAERRIAGTQEAMRLAHKLGADVVINRVGRVPAEADDPRFVRLAEVLAMLGAYGEHVGARLAAQTGSESGPQLAALLGTMPAGVVGVDLHPSGLIFGGFSVEEAVDALAPHVVHVHACDAVRDLRAGRGVEVELGRGTTDWPALFGRLEEFGYRGWVTIERRDAPDPAEEIGNAVAYLRALQG